MTSRARQLQAIKKPTFYRLVQRGPTTGPRNNFAQVLSVTGSGNLFFGERYDFGTKIGIWEIDSNRRPFFFPFREHPDFGTKIGITEIDSN